MRTQRARTQWAAVVASSLLAAAAWADHTITVDGADSDWAQVTSCFAEPLGDGARGVDLTRTCVTNDNASGDIGHVYTLYEAGSALPTNQDVYFGFAIDLNRDGQITSGDEAYAVVYPRSGSTQWSGVTLGVFDAVNYSVKRTYTSGADCGGSATSNGWSEAKVGSTVELSISYGCIPGMAYGADNRLFQMGVYPAFDLTAQLFYNGTSDALYARGTRPAPAGYPAVTARDGQATIFWTNPPDHDGTLVVRHVGPWGTANKDKWNPSDGAEYSLGPAAKGNPGSDYTVVFSESHGVSQSFTDTGLSNGTRYYYKVFNHNAGFTYASGEVPVPGGIFAEPRAAGPSAPIWCYSTSVTALQQPLVLLQTGTYSAGNGGALVALRTAPSAGNDGNELWRPVQLGGAIQSRFPAAPLYGRTGKFILAGTQSGGVAAVNIATGVPLWDVPGSSFGGDSVRTYLSAQLYNSSQTTAAFKAANPARDLIFVPTRITGSSNYKVVALSSVNGAKVWESAAMSPILGGMMVDYPRDRLYVPTASTGTGSLRILSTLDGTQVGSLSVGSVTQGAVKDFYWNKPVGELIVVNDAGTAFGFDLGWTTAPAAAAWSVSLGTGPTSFPIPMPNGFLISTRNSSATSPGAVQRFDVASTGATRVWSTPIQNPIGLWVEYDAANHAKRVWAGSSDIKLHGLDWATGTDSAQIPTGSKPGAPMDDYQVGRLMAGLEDGRICAFVLPP